ncbi:hypothetical protein OSCT_0302 [Oscillochloris trichoides DG-6]|uniref:Uncharacterized protein n=1 Tax=Oscillochloris trichoides DG-6 TaxID=765420 RepID=E1IAF1_9CHLR|nr:hypothetical protein OSCT_0302 [Oscillochloris trichoides DG-6]
MYRSPQLTTRRFNPPGGFGAFGTLMEDEADAIGMSFNPPGGFGAFGTCVRRVPRTKRPRFQSAGRIWGFRNPRGVDTGAQCATVSIRRADLGLSELKRDNKARITHDEVSIRRADLGLSEPGQASARYRSKA